MKFKIIVFVISCIFSSSLYANKKQNAENQEQAIKNYKEIMNEYNNDFQCINNNSPDECKECLAAIINKKYNNWIEYYNTIDEQLLLLAHDRNHLFSKTDLNNSVETENNLLRIKIYKILFD
jgi:hypothetical protein